MLRTVRARLLLPEGERAVASLGSIMHGHLMEYISPAWAARLHEEALRPYSQCVRREDGQDYWYLNALTEEAAENILGPAMVEGSFFSRQRDYSIGLGGWETVREESYDELEERFFRGAPYFSDSLTLLTPCAFKTGGEYEVFPRRDLLFKGLIGKWNAFSSSSCLEEENLAEHLAQSLRIKGYRLSLSSFSLEGRRVPAFIGELTLGGFKSEAAGRLASMLLYYASYAGLGIKTALGMGAFSVRAERRRT